MYDILLIMDDDISETNPNYIIDGISNSQPNSEYDDDGRPKRTGTNLLYVFTLILFLDCSIG